jgi:hypothetical protein
MKRRRKQLPQMGKKIQVGAKVLDPDFGTGKVVGKYDDFRWPHVVRFDEKHEGLPDCQGRTDKGHGAFFSEEEVAELMDNYNKHNQ